mmetsp:Transcript_42450/g.68394  ORF Transcript_42450/g.68394 Transcript_42450/m.68394 type:complete len:121 (-) Transcript_42450:524-886(-)
MESSRTSIDTYEHTCIHTRTHKFGYSADAINEEKKRRRKKVERTWQKMKKEKGTEDDGDRGKMSGSLKKDKINQPDFRGRNDEKTGSSNHNNPPLTHRVAPTGRKGCRQVPYPLLFKGGV